MGSSRPEGSRVPFKTPRDPPLPGPSMDGLLLWGGSRKDSHVPRRASKGSVPPQRGSTSVRPWGRGVLRSPKSDRRGYTDVPRTGSGPIPRSGEKWVYPSYLGYRVVPLDSEPLHSGGQDNRDFRRELKVPRPYSVYGRHTARPGSSNPGVS